MAITDITIYTDGACSGNPGPGGWGCLLMAGGHTKELSGAASDTTNNRMEMTAVIEAFKALKYPCNVAVYSDSAYVVNAFNEDWIGNWQRKGWKNASGAPVSNQDLWLELLRVIKGHQVVWHKVKGHSDNPYNNRCDELAVKAARSVKA